MAHTLAELAKYVNGTVNGDGDCVIVGVATLENAGEGQLAFLSNRKYRRHLQHTRAAAVVLAEADAADCPVSALVVKDPYVAYARIASLLNPPRRPPAGVHASAVIADDCALGEGISIGARVSIAEGCRIADNVVIGPGCVLGDNVSIGAGTVIEANVTLWHDTEVGADCLIHSGAVIGADGFGIALDRGEWIKVPQLGRVVIGDRVEIGANTTIDRGALENTRIGTGVKLDNLIQIGHNVVLGDHTVVAAHTAIAGSTHIGKHCAIGGCVGIVGHLEIADRVQITGGSVVTSSIGEPGVYSSGTPLQENRAWHRNFVRFKQLDEMARSLRRLERGSGDDE